MNITVRSCKNKIYFVTADESEKGTYQDALLSKFAHGIEAASEILLA